MQISQWTIGLLVALSVNASASPVQQSSSGPRHLSSGATIRNRERSFVEATAKSSTSTTKNFSGNPKNHKSGSNGHSATGTTRQSSSSGTKHSSSSGAKHSASSHDAKGAGKGSTTGHQSSTGASGKSTSGGSSSSSKGKGKKPVNGAGHSSGVSLGDEQASTTEIDCDDPQHPDDWQACNSICFSALGSPVGYVTGLKLGSVNSSPLEKGDGTSAYNQVSRKNREWTGALRSRNGWTSVGGLLTGPSPDEWPPAASKSGGVMSDGWGVPVQFISAAANSHVGTMLNRNVGGYIVLKNYHKADVCVAIEHDFSGARDEYCGRDRRFAQFRHPGQPRVQGEWRVAFRDSTRTNRALRN